MRDTGRIVVGRQGPSPFMIAELAPVGGATLIERLYFPRPFRRAKLMARGLAATVSLAMDRSPEVLMMADEHRPWQQEVATSVGFTVREQYRLVVLR